MRGTAVVVVSAIVAAMLALSGAVAAQPRQPKKKAASPGESPMEVHVVRSADPGCEPACPQWIAAQGRIAPGTAKKFRKVLRSLGDRKLPIFIDSFGGSIVDAYAMGRLIRARHLTVAVTATTFSPCAPRDLACRRAKTGGELRGLARPSMSKCASACVFVLAGGTRRLVGEGAAVGVHQAVKIQRMYWVKKRRASDGSIRTTKSLAWEGRRPMDRKTRANMRKYLAEMGMSDALMSLIEATPHESIRRLAGWELQATRVATEYLNGEQLLAGTPAPPFPAPPAPFPLRPALSPGAHDACFKPGQCDENGIPRDIESLDSPGLSRDAR